MNLDEIKIKTEVRKINKGYLYAAFTDKIFILKWPLSIQDEEMLEQSFQKISFFFINTAFFDVSSMKYYFIITFIIAILSGI